MKNFSKEYGKIMTTKEYDLFALVEGNRNIDFGKVQKLKKSMEEKQLVIPIIINEKYEIIDGQHRFMSCKELGLPIYYLMVEGYGIEEVKRSNIIATTWSLSAFLNLYCTENKTDYLLFKDLIDTYNISIAFLIELKSAFSKTALKREQELFRIGEFKFDGVEDDIENFLSSLEMFDSFKNKRTNSFLKAYLELFNRKEFDKKIMKEQCKKFGFKLSEPTDKSKTGYLSVLVNDIYSYRAAKKRLKYDKGSKDFYIKEK